MLEAKKRIFAERDLVQNSSLQTKKMTNCDRSPILEVFYILELFLSPGLAIPEV